jgi:hypothetical protein
MNELPATRRDASFEPTDIPAEKTTGDLVEEMDLTPGDWYAVDDVVRKVVTIDTRMAPSDRDSLSVTNPLVDHPQDAEAGTWPTPLAEVYADWRSGDLEPAQVAVSTPSQV